MNITKEKNIHDILKKLNTAKTAKQIAKDITEDLLKLTAAEACWFCLINPATNKIELKRFYYAPGMEKNLELKRAVEKIYMVGEDLLTNNYETDDILDYFNSFSKEKIIVEPIIYRNYLLGYIGLFSREENFVNKNRDSVGIITENTNSRLEVIALKEELEKNNRDKVQFLASISHEYKTPLNSIIGFSDILKSKCPDTDNFKYIDNISKSSRFLLSLIHDILDLARSEFKPLELKYEIFRPKEIISDIIYSFEETRKERLIEFSYTLADVELFADLRRFQQLIYNLISNAVKFSKDKGKITIVTYVNENNEFVFEIKDSGDGIRKKDYGKIFNFFSQVNGSQLKRQQGSGVGLALCKTIVNAHRGEIGFKSRINHGSTFWFTIPNDEFNNNEQYI